MSYIIVYFLWIINSILFSLQNNQSDYYSSAYSLFFLLRGLDSIYDKSKYEDIGRPFGISESLYYSSFYIIYVIILCYFYTLNAILYFILFVACAVAFP